MVSEYSRAHFAPVALGLEYQLIQVHFHRSLFLSYTPYTPYSLNLALGGLACSQGYLK